MQESGPLAKLRGLMAVHGLDYYLVLSQDEHNSEYVACADKRREFISGFTGSAGTAIIGRSGYCELATDGRYWLQAADELSSDWVLRKENHPGIVTWSKAISSRAKEEGAVIGVDPRLITFDTAKLILGSGADLRAVEPNLVDEVWVDKPAEPSQPVFALGLEYSGVDTQSKLENLRFHLTSRRADAIALAALDEIAWLLNLRGSDIEYNPVFKAYALVTKSETRLYLNQTRELPALPSRVRLLDYSRVFEDMAELAQQGKKIELSSKASWAAVLAAGQGAVVTDAQPVALAKAVKNDVEIAGARRAQVYCGTAVVRLLCWLGKRLAEGAEVTEFEASQQLEKFRQELPEYQGPSFETIASSGANAAVIHYTPSPTTSSYISKDAVFLLDTGSQFLYGTTDTTRTVFYGDAPPAALTSAYTLVLKGHLALARARFPVRTAGYQLDVLARQFLWNEGLDYVHSTGHGVGAFLNVHEGPVGIGPDAKRWSAQLAPGAILSNEPGYYKAKQFGVRIESLVVVQQRAPREFLEFETITLVPFARNLIELDRLTTEERLQIDQYHAHVRAILAPHLSDADLEYLLEHTEPLPANS